MEPVYLVEDIIYRLEVMNTARTKLLLVFKQLLNFALAQPFRVWLAFFFDAARIFKLRVDFWFTLRSYRLLWCQ